MKVNVGCGTTYKEGHLNVDAFDDTVADKLMSATNLKLDDNSADEIYASQLIEHLGITGSIYALSECFRVLKPQEKLIIETPDLQKSCEIYANGDREDRKQILPWIYGVDIPGMVHRFCYPEDLLEETLQKIGFTNICKEYMCYDPYEPIVKVVCEKPAENAPYHCMATFRKHLLQTNMVDLDNQLTALEQERLLELFIEIVVDFFQTDDPKSIEELITKGGVQHPAMTKLLIEHLQKVTDKKIVGDHHVLTFLIDIDFPCCLMHSVSQTPGFVGKQQNLFSAIYKLGVKSIENLLQHNDTQNRMSALREMSKQTTADDNIPFFSPKIIMLHARRFYSVGIKEFVLRNYEKSQTLLEQALSYYRDDLLMYWNYARILRMRGEEEQAQGQYQHTFYLIDTFDHGTQNDAIKQALTTEMQDGTSDIYKRPITSVRNLTR
ncbi:MAG: methyltransferase domain-containing protein [Candidatus Thermoplasmatota archaeon]|nr:methyltransferase domain-containing protein [Candidatus Thermoplasmatota archaeon]